MLKENIETWIKIDRKDYLLLSNNCHSYVYLWTTFHVRFYHNVLVTAQLRFVITLIYKSRIKIRLKVSVQLRKLNWKFGWISVELSKMLLDFLGNELIDLNMIFGCYRLIQKLYKRKFKIHNWISGVWWST